MTEAERASVDWSSPTPYAGQFTDLRFDLTKMTLHALEWNPTAIRTVLLIHGINTQAHTWDPIASVLARRYRVIAPDLRGHGDSGWAPEGYRVRQLAGDLQETLDVLGVETLDVVGHSLGARVAIALARQRSGTITRLVLSEGAPQMGGTALAASSRVAVKEGTILGFNDQNAALAYYQGLYPDWVPVFHELHVRHQLRLNWAAKWVNKADPDLFWLRGKAGRLDDEYLWDCLEGLGIPILVVRGTHSEYISPNTLERMTSRPNVQLRTLEASHYVPREHPDEFTRAVLDFIG
jgi:pimeloyl-ACP methyl ester carboxylesterase